MSKHDIVTSGQLVYGGVSIRDKGEMISLTDMWKAAGADPQKAPAKWRTLPGTKAFVDHVELTIGKSDSELFKVSNGGRSPGTWANWQVAMAYAKYLSPEFHMWCNEVVRAHMEGDKISGIPSDTLDQIERSFGIMRMLAHKVTEMGDDEFSAHITALTYLEQRILRAPCKTAQDLAAQITVLTCDGQDDACDDELHALVARAGGEEDRRIAA